MPILADYHLHSHFSGDCDSPMEQMILSAIERGLTRMCFTEHMDLDYPISEETPAGTFELNVDSYLFDLIKYREKYADKIQVNFGIELGMQPQIIRENARIAKGHDFDFIIASSHLVKGIDPYFPKNFEHLSDEELYRAYFEEELKNIKSFSNFDVYGHIDYVVRYGRDRDKNYSYEKYADLFDQMIDSLIDREKGIEINTGGLRKGLREANPCTAFLKKYRERGGEIITVGSDAHFPQHIAADFDRAAEILKEYGFKYYCSFEKRSPAFHKL